MTSTRPTVESTGGTGERPVRVFTVRIWAEQEGDAIEHRGTVRDVESGAFRSFRRWADLTAFLSERLSEDPISEEEGT